MKELNPYDIAHQLARSIISSEAYILYTEAQKKIETNTELKTQIIDFRSKQMEVNRKQFAGEEVSGEIINEITREFAKLNTKQDIAEFFKAEANFVQMFNDIQEIIQKAVQEGFIE